MSITVPRPEKNVGSVEELLMPRTVPPIHGCDKYWGKYVRWITPIHCEVTYQEITPSG